MEKAAIPKGPKYHLANIFIKIRKEMRSAVKKERILNEEDALLIKQFLNKINSEIK